MAVTTYGAIVESALKEIGVLAAGETMSAEDGSDGLDALNMLLDQWKSERLTIYTVTRTTWAITSSVGSYAVGTGSVVNFARPNLQEINEVRFQDTSVSPTLEYPLLQLTENDYARIPQKTLTSTQPTSFYYNPTFPTGLITFWPVPTSATLQGVLYALAAVGEAAALTTLISLPPGYRRALIKNLAEDLASGYGRPVPPELAMEAERTLNGLKASNQRPSDLSFDAGALGDTGYGFWSIRQGP